MAPSPFNHLVLVEEAMFAIKMTGQPFARARIAPELHSAMVDDRTSGNLREDFCPGGAFLVEAMLVVFVAALPEKAVLVDNKPLATPGFNTVRRSSSSANFSDHMLINDMPRTQIPRIEFLGQFAVDVIPAFADLAFQPAPARIQLIGEFFDNLFARLSEGMVKFVMINHDATNPFTKSRPLMAVRRVTVLFVSGYPAAFKGRARDILGTHAGLLLNYYGILGDSTVVQ